MGYSTSRKTLAKMMPHLQPLLEGEFPSWKTTEGQAAKFAYQIREALYIARLYAKEYPELATIAGRITVLTPRPDKVTIKEAENTPVVVADEGLTIQGLNTADAPSDPGARSADAIIAEFKAAPTNNKRQYRNLPLAELHPLYTFLQTVTPRWYMFVSGNGNGTVNVNINKDEDFADFAWTPEDTL